MKLKEREDLMRNLEFKNDQLLMCLLEARQRLPDLKLPLLTMGQARILRQERAGPRIL
jgi:hypothetical protein